MRTLPAINSFVRGIYSFDFFFWGCRNSQSREERHDESFDRKADKKARRTYSVQENFLVRIDHPLASPLVPPGAVSDHHLSLHSLELKKQKEHTYLEYVVKSIINFSPGHMVFFLSLLPSSLSSSTRKQDLVPTLLYHQRDDEDNEAPN